MKIIYKILKLKRKTYVCKVCQSKEKNWGAFLRCLTRVVRVLCKCQTTMRVQHNDMLNFKSVGGS